MKFLTWPIIALFVAVFATTPTYANHSSLLGIPINGIQIWCEDKDSAQELLVDFNTANMTQEILNAKYLDPNFGCFNEGKEDFVGKITTVGFPQSFRRTNRTIMVVGITETGSTNEMIWALAFSSSVKI